MNKQRFDLIIGALFRDGGELYGALSQLLAERIDFVNRQSPSEGDVMKDIPKIYKKEGALDELRSMRASLQELEKEFKRRQGI